MHLGYYTMLLSAVLNVRIFGNNKDRDDLLTRLHDLLPGTNTSCYAWARLSNHAFFYSKHAIFHFRP